MAIENGVLILMLMLMLTLFECTRQDKPDESRTTLMRASDNFSFRLRSTSPTRSCSGSLLLLPLACVFFALQLPALTVGWNVHSDKTCSSRSRRSWDLQVARNFEPVRTV